MSKFFIYAIIVTLVTAGSSWTRMLGGSGGVSRGSAWTSHTGGGGGSWGGGSGGGGHK
jgi:endoglucanase/acidic type I keratin